MLGDIEFILFQLDNLCNQKYLNGAMTTDGETVLTTEFNCQNVEYHITATVRGLLAKRTSLLYNPSRLSRLISTCIFFKVVGLLE